MHKLQFMKLKVLILALLCVSLAKAQETWEVGATTLTEYDLVTGVQIPWEIMWGPDDYIWATERRGRVLRINPADGNYTTVLNIQSNISGGGSGEPGLLGMASDPNFDDNPYIYLVYNYGSWPYSERISRFAWDGISLVDEEILLDDLVGGGIHNGARILVLEDNTLMVSMGDKGTGSSSQNLNSLDGKTLRMNLDGSIPADNPDPTSYVYSIGHRNSQGLCLGPNGLIYSSEHGQNSNDEFNIIEPNRNYGWPTVEGMCNGNEQTFCDENNVKEPIVTWSPCPAVNGIFYYNHPAIPEWENSVLMAVLGGLGAQYERLSVLHMSDDGLEVESEDEYFSEFNQRVRDICVNPTTGAVYVAFNGPQYPGSGPNIIKEFVNLEYGANSVAEANIEQEIKLYPNPASDVVNLEFDDNFLGTSYQVISFTGQTVERDIVKQNKMELDVTTWATGKYYLVATSQIGTVTRTFIVK